MASFEAFKTKLVEFSIDMHDNMGIPRNVVDQDLEKINSLIGETLIPFFNNSIQNIIKTDCSNDTRGEVRIFFENFRFPLRSLLTEHDRVKAYKRANLFVEPEKEEIGRESIFVIVHMHEIKVEYVIREIVHIPMDKSFKKVLETPGLMDLVDDYDRKLRKEPEFVSNIKQGKMWKEKYNQGYDHSIHVDATDSLPTTFPSHIWLDELETGNGMGSAAGVQKLAAIFASFPFLPPHIASKNSSIILVSVFKSKYHKLFGNSAIFRRPIEELNDLKRYGITIEIRGLKRTIRFQVTLLLGDNLALNEACGFKCGFVLSLFCRICSAPASLCKLMCCIDRSFVRTKTSYDHDVEKPAATSGLTERCVFNDVDRFHISENKSCDLMHDVSGGVIPQTLSRVLTGLIIEDKRFTVADLNIWIKKFDFGAEKNKPRPVLVEVEKDKNGHRKRKIKLKQSSAEALCLCQYLGLIVAHRVPPANRHWLMYSKLRQIVDIVTAPRYVVQDLASLRIYLREHNTMYYDLYGDLKPKMHLLLHYLELMELNGPAVHFWSMPFERKNKDLRSTAVSLSSNVNLPWSVAFRYQITFCNIQKRITELMPLLKLGAESQKSIKQLHNLESWHHVPNEKPNGILYNWVEFRNIRYQKGAVIFMGYDRDGDPIFRQVERVYLLNQTVFLVTRTIVTLYFESHRHAYEIQLGEIDGSPVQLNSLPAQTKCILIKKGNIMFIATRHQM
ncbi:hypothetical protein QAD02_002568 [Eretmocerus hayati]|uniref:Uncharacterized protein n=1 Tax=Eretmocerus hayati TaxID=131215 RepID=A0ACC2NJK4_9HYME|nr:hypothetical protein QAD02_002568 [Eretmocerus hayati]